VDDAFVTSIAASPIAPPQPAVDVFLHWSGSTSLPLPLFLCIYAEGGRAGRSRAGGIGDG